VKIDRGREAIDVDCLVPYPEGTAMKNKKTSDQKRFFLHRRIRLWRKPRMNTDWHGYIRNAELEFPPKRIRFRWKEFSICVYQCLSVVRFFGLPRRLRSASVVTRRV